MRRVPGASGAAETPGEKRLAPAAEEKPGDFFELAPEEVPGYQPTGQVVARRPRRDVKPLLKAAAGLLVTAGLVVAAILIWPSAHARVPDLVGKILKEAIGAARESGLQPVVTAWEYSNSRSDGVVLAQAPAGGSRVGKGSRLSMTVCKGPMPESGAGEVSTRAGGGAAPGGEKVITIDAGHQALPAYSEWVDPDMTRRAPVDPGGRGVNSGNYEYAVTVDIALKLKGLLEKDGIAVQMTRETNTIDLPCVTRAEMANDAGSLLAVHIHCGVSADPETMGIFTMTPARNAWTDGFYEESKTAALFIQEQLVKSCELDDMGVLATHDLPEFNWSKVPTVEPRIGFLTNPRDDGFLADDQFRWKAAWGLRNGIRKHLDNL